MTLIDFYPGIKLVHVTAVIASGSLFSVRGLSINWGSGWGMTAPVRYLSYAIDVTLLAAALALLAILPTAVYGNGWLTVKLILLVVYIGLGTLALKRGRTVTVKRACFIAAIGTYVCMYLVARSHDPLGPVTFLQAMLR